MYFRHKFYICIGIFFTLLLNACSIETYLLVDTIKFSPQPVKVQSGKQTDVSIEFKIKRSNGACHVTDKGEIELELLDQDKESPVAWLANYQALPNPIPFNGNVRKGRSCHAEASLNFHIGEEAPLGLQRIKILLAVSALDLLGKQYVDFLIEIVP